MSKAKITVSNINLRSKGLVGVSGKLHKGCVKDATSKLSIGSIPATYQSIIYRNESKKAFGTSQKRFYNKSESQKLIQNGEQTSDLSTQSQNGFQTPPNLLTEKKTFNTEGNSAFISKVRRDFIRNVKTPGPAHYHKTPNGNEKKEIQRKCKTRQQKTRNSQTIGRIFSRTTDCWSENPGPGPGHYLLEEKQFCRTSSNGCKSSFETKVGRNGYIPVSVSPGPGVYETVDKDCKVQRQSKNKSKQTTENQKMDKHIAELIIEQNLPKPGPGWYNHEIPSFKPLYERIKMSRNFIAPIYENKRRGKKSPDPTMYNIKRMYDEIKPKLIESTAFMSEAKRQVFKGIETAGPTVAPVPLPGSKNFHFNIKDEWMC